MKTIRFFISTLCFFLLFASIASAQDLNPSYRESVDLAIDHAKNPDNWRPSSLFVISPTAPASQGLTYDNGDPNTGNLIVRTATSAGNYSSNYVGQAGYKIWKPSDPQHYASWVTTGNDATRFLQANGATGATVTKLLEQGLGMNRAGTHNAVVEFTVAPTNDNIQRATHNPDITQYLPSQYYDTSTPVQSPGMTDQKFTDFTAYYNNFKTDAYNTADANKMFPFGQLGYTFFWGNGYTLNNINGMTEFIMLGGTPVGIYGIYATQSYIYTLNKNGAFSTATDAQYGNGFASFKIDGTCDTVWAGHRFQKNVSTNTGDGSRNQIRIENTGSVSGGQGLLIWSLNYDVENNGTISGATANKFGISDTSNIAVFFKGDTGNNYGTPITTAGAVNRLTNAGTISSPGTAVKAEAGNTEITNQGNGIISGGTYAIRTGTGDDTVTVKGGEIAGKVDLGTGTDTFAVTGADGNAKLSLTLSKDTASSAQVLVKDTGTGTVNIADHTKIAVTMSGTKNVQNNDRFLVVDTNTLTVTPSNLTIQNDPALPQVTFSATKSDDGKQLYLVASRNSTYYGTSSGNTSLGNLLDRLANSATGDFANVLGDLDKSGNAADARKLEPTVNRGTVQAGFGTATQFTQTVVNRVDRVWSGTEATGIAAGDELEKWGVWAQGFGSYLNQAATGSNSGYTANVWGGTLGFDRLVYDNVLVGLSGGYARNAIRTADEETKTNADSYQGSVYGSLTRNAYTMTALLSYAYNRYDASRHIAFGTTNRTAKSHYDGQQYSGYLEGGYTMKHQGFHITPIASVQYMRLHLGDYAESGADSLNLAVETQRYQMFQTGLGAKLAYPIRHKDTQILPELHARWLYDFVGDPQQATASFTSGGASFAAQGIDPPKSSYQIGAKISLMTAGNFTFALNYDFDFKQDFYRHSGYVSLRYVF